MVFFVALSCSRGFSGLLQRLYYNQTTPFLKKSRRWIGVLLTLNTGLAIMGLILVSARYFELLVISGSIYESDGLLLFDYYFLFGFDF